jgi:hypothetical protein
LNRRGFINTLTTIAAALPLAGCWGSTYEWNQKLTLVVDTPEGEKSGAAVTSIFVRSGQMPASASAVSYKMNGEATVVEVAPGKYLFALLGDLETKELAARVWPGGGNDADTSWARNERRRESKVLPPKLYPMLVSFKDITDPKSVFEVKPDDIASAFGPGYALKSITLEITDEPVIEGVVEKVLPLTFFKRWGSEHSSALARGTNDPYFKTLMASLSRGNFIKGQVK